MRRLWLFVAGLSAICSPAWADHAESVKAIVQPLIDSKMFVGCVVGVVDHGRTEVYGFGEVKKGSGERPNGNTEYEIASITKGFTAILLADMIERGKLDLDTPVQELLPPGVTLQVVDDQPITLRHLVTHTSGLPRMPSNFAPKDPLNPYLDYTDERFFNFLNGFKPPRSPGESEYSNLGMALLGQLIARKAGKSYEELLIERICDPLDMNDTRITLSDAQQKRMAAPYNEQLKPDHTWDLVAFEPAGGIRSTANDMLKLLAAGMSDDDRPVVRATHRAWTKLDESFTGGGICMAWCVAKDGVRRWHNGRTGGYSSIAFACPPKQLGVVLLANTASNAPLVVGDAILQSLQGIEPEPIVVRNSIDVPPEVLRQYVGSYELAPKFTIAITLDDGLLKAQATGQGKVPILPRTETDFYCNLVDAQFTFVKDDDGRVTKLVLHQLGRDLPAPKVDKPAEPAAKPDAAKAPR